MHSRGGGPGADTIVVGGGIAGLSALFHLAGRFRAGAPSGSALLLEREPLCGAAASGRNAGIFRHLEHDEVSATLAARSRALIRGLFSDSDHLVRDTGGLYLSSRRACLDHLAALAAEVGLEARMIEPGGHPAAADLLRGSEAGLVLHVPRDGVLDTHALLESVRRRALDLGAGIRCRATVRRLLTSAGRVTGVELEDGERIACRRLVLAAGAWSTELAGTAGASVVLAPMRRHLVFLGSEKPYDADIPVLWRVDEEGVYLRPESGGLLASPCDEEPWAATAAPEVDSGVLLDLAHRLSRGIPGAAESEVRRFWACLRTFAPDRRPVVGLDPRVEGLYWIAGLGGQGLSTAMAAGEALASIMAGESHPLAAALSPDRLGGDLAA